MRIAPGAVATVADSIVWGFASGFSGSFAAPHSDYPGAAGAVDPGFVAAPGDLGLGDGSPLVDAGDPEPLGDAEPLADADGAVRAMDGNGDGTARRDVGALERRPPLPPGTRGNLLANPGAEQGTAATDDTASPAPPRWVRTGAFTSVRYGTVAGPFAFPPLDAAAWLRGGDAFFAGGPGGAASLSQVVDVSRWAPEIDGRAGVRARLSALLGGFRRSEDRATVSAEFRGPTGVRRGGFALDTVTPAERANATMLAARLAERPIPRLTRTIAVTVRAGSPAAATTTPTRTTSRSCRAPALPGVRRPGAGRRPFAGVLLLSRRVRWTATAARACGSGARPPRSGPVAASSRSRGCGPRCSAPCAWRCSPGASGAYGSRSRGARGARSPAGARRATCTRPPATARASPAPPSRRCGSCAVVNLGARATRRRRRQHADPLRHVPGR